MKAGSAPASVVARMGDYEDWIRATLPDDIRVHIAFAQRVDRLPALSSVAGCIITGSPAMVTDREPWSLALERWTIGAVEHGVPTLGICYGHQLLAQALGGEVADRPNGVEIGTVQVRRTADGESDPLFGRLPAEFGAQTIHWQSVVRLPSKAVLLAQTDADELHAFRYGLNAWGVQFHPEFSAAAMAGHFDVLAGALTRQGVDAERLAAAIATTPDAQSILPAFVRHAMRRVL